MQARQGQVTCGSGKGGMSVLLTRTISLVVTVLLCLSLDETVTVLTAHAAIIADPIDGVYQANAPSSAIYDWCGVAGQVGTCCGDADGCAAPECNCATPNIHQTMYEFHCSSTENNNPPILCTGANEIDGGGMFQPSDDDGNFKFESALVFPYQWPFYGEAYDHVYVQVNGVITFDSPQNDHFVEPFPRVGAGPMIAALWADADVRNKGKVLFRQFPCPDPSDTNACRDGSERYLQRAQNDVRSLYGAASNFVPTHMFMVNWHQVRMYDGNGEYNTGKNTPKNNFQLVLITDGDKSFVMFNFHEPLEWLCSADSDERDQTQCLADGNPTCACDVVTNPRQLGTCCGYSTPTSNPACAFSTCFNSVTNQYYSALPHVGFDRGVGGIGNHENVYAQTPDVENIHTASNVNFPGRFLFRIDLPEIYDPPVEPTTDSTLASLVVSGGVAELSPAFTPEGLEYTLSIVDGDQYKILLVCNDIDAAAYLDGSSTALPNGIPSAQYPSVASGPAVDVEILVVSAAGAPNVRTITLHITYAASDNADLSSIVMVDQDSAALGFRNPVTQDPVVFNSGVVDYFRKVDSSTTSVTIDSLATTAGTALLTSYPAAGTDSGTGSVQSSFPLLFGDISKFEVTCTAEDLVTTKKYSVSVTMVLSVDTSFSSVTVNGVVPLGDTSLTIDVTNDVNTAVIVMQTSDPNALLAKTPVTAYTKQDLTLNVNLVDGVNTVNVKVCSEECTGPLGNEVGTSRLYSFAITRVQSTDASLATLHVAETNLGYDTGLSTLVNTATVAHYFRALVFNVLPGDPVGASMLLNPGNIVLTSGVDSQSRSLSTIPPEGGSVVYTIATTAQSGAVVETSYTVTRSAAPDLGTTMTDTNACVQYVETIALTELRSVLVTVDSAVALFSDADGVDYLHITAQSDSGVVPTFSVDGVQSATRDGFSYLTLVYVPDGVYSVEYTSGVGEVAANIEITLDICSGSAEALTLNSELSTSVDEYGFGMAAYDVPAATYYAFLDYVVADDAALPNSETYYETRAVDTGSVVGGMASAGFPKTKAEFFNQAYVAANNPDATTGESLATITAPTDDTRMLWSVFAVHDTTNSNNLATYSLGLTPQLRAPEITNVQPNTGPSTGGNFITITGTNFEPTGSTVSVTGTVTVGGNLCASPFYLAGKIVCTAPGGEGTNVPVVVAMYGESSVGVNDYSYNAPTITGISFSDAVKPTTGQFTMIVSGTNFGASPSVRVNGVATIVDFVAVDGTRIEVMVGEGEGTADVEVDVSGQTVTQLDAFSYDKPLVLNTIVVDDGTEGGHSLVLIGQNFGTAAATLTGSIGAGNQYPLSYVSHNHTVAFFTTSAGTGSDKQIVVDVSGVTSDVNPSETFSYGAPVFDNLNQATQTVDPTQSSFIITGSNFGPTGGATISLTALGTSGLTITSRAENSLTVTVPARGASVPSDAVITVDGQQSVAFELIWTSPRVDSTDLSSVSAAGELITVTGEHFTGAPAFLRTGGISYAAIVNSDTELTANFPAGSGPATFTIIIAGSESADYAISYSSALISGLVFTPDSLPLVAGGTVVEISGTNLGNGAGSSVLVNGVICALTDSWTNTLVKCTVPSGVGLGVSLVVRIGGVDTATTFNYAAPELTGTNPSILETGGAELLNVGGLNFGDSEGTITVDSLACDVIAWSEDAIVCSTPAGRGDPVTIEVTTAGQSGTRAVAYSIPVITSITAPAEGFLTKGAVDLTIDGSSFDTYGGSTLPSVTIDGQVCTVSGANAALWDHERIYCELPAGTGKNLDAVVTTRDATAVSVAFDFAYDKPVISDVQPGSVSASGDIIVITGKNFGSVGFGATTIELDGGVACDITSGGANYDDNTITCALADTPASAVPTVVVTCDGQASFPYSLDLAAPLVTSIDPPNGITGPVGTTLLTIDGANFGDGSLATNVKVGTAPCTDIVVNPTQITCKLPAGTDSQPVVVTVSGKASSGSIVFEYDAPAVSFARSLSEFDQSISTTGEVILVCGTSFGVAGTVSIGGQECNTKEQNHTCIKCGARAGAGQNLLVQVQTGLQTSIEDVRIRFDAPSISGYSPTTVRTNGTTLLTITGDNFGPDSGSEPVVTIDTAPCFVQAYNHTEIVCMPTAGTGENLNLIVKAGNVPSAPFPLSFAAPRVAAVTPIGLTTGGNVEVTITGHYFGSSGLVEFGDWDGIAFTNIGVCVVTTAVKYTDDSIKCKLPPGQGTKRVRVTADGQASDPDDVDSAYTYGLPTLNALVEPASGDTSYAGGFFITLTGTSFGQTATVTVGGEDCPEEPDRHTATTIVCTLPENTVGDAAVVVTVSGQSSQESVFFTYNNPTISDIDPPVGTTNSGAGTNAVTPLTINGNNFGSSASIVSVTVGGVPAGSLSHTHKEIVLASIPNGVGIDKDVVVSVDGESTTLIASFAYSVPVVGSITSVVFDVNSAPVVGGGMLTIGGSNFGTAATVIVGANSCDNPVTNTEGTQVTCDFPGGKGRDVDVVVTAGGQESVVSGSTQQISYATPVIDANTLCDSASCAKDTFFDLSSTTGGEVMQFEGNNFNTGSGCTVLYGVVGSTAETAQYTCASSTCSGEVAQCTLQSPTVGTNLVFFVHDLATDQYSNAGTDTLNSLLPQILDTTISTDGTNKFSTITGTSSTGQNIYLDVLYAGNDATFLSMVYGNDGNYDEFACAALTVESYDAVSQKSQVKCATIAAEGVDHQFRLTANGAQSLAIDNNRYAYPTSPVILGVTGTLGVCTSQWASGTVAAVDCPTDGGGERLNITGINFGSTSTVKIGAADCINPQTVAHPGGDPDLKSILCDLPVGAGLNLAVTVALGGASSLVSQSAYLLSYSKPVITGITGCTVDGATTVDCDRNTGSTVITITGTDFGASGALIFVGSNICGNPVHTGHTQVTCDLPSGVGSAEVVFLIQNGGSVTDGANTGIVGYTQCQSGFYQASNTDYDCTVCPKGTYTNGEGATVCAPCESGTNSSTEQTTECDTCPPGRISLRDLSMDRGPLVCEACATGKHQAAPGQASCVDCEPGFYQDDEGEDVCKECLAGTANSDTGQPICSTCIAGTVSPVPAQKLCTPCEVGSYIGSDNEQVCTLCEPGRYQDESSKSTCKDCEKGHAREASGQPSCIACDSGEFANVTGLIKCFTCPVGKFSEKVGVAGPTDCTNCTAGKYSSSDGQGGCTDCPVATYQDGVGKSFCHECPAGESNNDVAQTNCGGCDKGYFSLEGSVECLECPSGKFSNETGSSECVECARGRYGEFPKASVCEDCAVGRVQAVAGQVGCEQCEVGFYANRKGLKECLRCAAGNFSSSAGSAVCELCAVGKFTGGDVQAICSDCPAGTYSGSEGLSECEPCIAGKFSGAGASMCKDCAKGFFSPVPGSIVCNECVKGTYSSVNGSEGCDSCPSGSFQALAQQSFCNNCTVGLYSPFAGYTECLECDVGKFQNMTRAKSCDPCTPGSSQPSTGKTECTPCAKGRATSATGQANCAACGVGKHANVTGLRECHACQKGRHADSTGSLDCDVCDTGKFAGATGSVVCVPCAVGSAQSAQGSVACDECGPGTFQEAGGKPICDECPPGKANSAVGQPICEDCTPGKFSNDTGLDLCYPCKKGSVSSGSNAQSCSLCGGGKYAGSDGLATCKECPQGRFVGEDGGADECEPCSPGTFQGSTGRSVCEPCDPGKSSTTQGAVSCPPCGVGSYARDFASPNCTICPEGFSCPVGSQEPVACGPGFFAGAVGQAVCVKCDAGSYSDQLNNSACIPCLSGSYAGSPQATACINCTYGTAALAQGQFACAPCGPGTFADKEGQDTCKDCPMGRFQTASFGTECDVCPDGQVATIEGLSICAECPLGSFSNLTNPVPDECTPCPKGYAQNEAGKTYCDACGEGQYMTATGQAVCLECDSGTYTNVTGKAVCDNCPKGRTSEKIASVGPTECVVCEKGTYADQQGRFECKKCEVGKFASNEGQHECEPCPRGRHAETTGQTVCSLCDAGTFSGQEGAILCATCDSGRAADSNGAIECSQCGAGRFQSNTSATHCEECPAGEYTDSNGKVACSPCELGSAQPLKGQTQCNPCGPGTIQGAGAGISCDPCNPGEYIGFSGQAVCSPCEPGTASNDTGAPFCPECIAGFAQSASGAAECHECDFGKFASGLGTELCTPCDSGKYLNKTGGTICTKCEIGRFVTSQGAQECNVCPPGTSNDAEGQETCVSCASGKFKPINVSALLECTSCPVGTSQVQRGMSFCDPCPVGEAAGSTGSEDCTECRPGSYNPLEQQAFCFPCNPGTYQDVKGKSACNLCEHGRFAAFKQQPACTLCPAGKFQNQLNATVCTDCAKGRYQNEAGTSECLDCVVGKYSPSTGGALCQFCLPGTFANDTGNEVCSTCTKGRYTAEFSVSVCQECEVGKFTPSQGAQQCALCPAGTFSNSTGALECESCEAGYYQDTEGQKQCSACTPGKYAKEKRAEICRACEAGRFTDQYESIECTDCEAGYFRTATGGEQCDICRAGKYSTSGAEVCLRCADNGIAPTDGLSKCIPCEGNSRPNVGPNPTRCSCPEGFASFIEEFDGEDAQNNISRADRLKVNSTEAFCKECPEGARCPEGETWATMKAVRGYWGAQQGNYYRCLYENHCCGGTNDLTNDVQCCAHRTGALCALCEDGYSPTIAGVCDACGSEQGSIGFTVMMFLILGGLLLLQFFLLLRASRRLLNASVFEEARKAREAEGYMDDPNAFDFAEDPEQDDFHMRYDGELTIHGPPPAKPDFTYKLKILLGFIQIVTNLAVGLDIQWPTLFIEFINIFNPTSLDFIQLAAVDCVADTNYFWKLYAWCSFPPLLIGALLVFYLMPIYVMNPPSGENDVIRKRRVIARKKGRRNFQRLFLFSLFLIYPTVSSTIVRTFVCQKVEDDFYLKADFNVKCYEGLWNDNSFFAYAMVIVYPIGIPLYFFRKMWQYRHRLDEKGVRAELGFLYDAYERKVWWFEMCDMLHKLVVTSFVAFLPFEYQMPVAMVFVYLYMGVLLAARPYIRKGDDRLHLVAQTEIIVLLLSGNVFNTQQEPDEFMEVLMSVVLIMMVITFVMWWGFATVKVALKLFARSEKGCAAWCRNNRVTRAIFGIAGTEMGEVDDDGNIKAKTNMAKKKKRGASLIGDMYQISRTDLNASSKRRGIITDTLNTSNATVTRNPLWEADAESAFAQSDALDDMQINPMHDDVADYHDEDAHEEAMMEMAANPIGELGQAKHEETGPTRAADTEEFDFGEDSV